MVVKKSLVSKSALWWLNAAGCVPEYREVKERHTVVNMKLYVLYRMVPLSMTLSDPKPQFKGHSIV